MSASRLNVWITRAQPAAEATAGRVRALGHEPFVAPLLRVRRIEDARIDLRGVAALAFTSANGVQTFAQAEPRRDLRVFAVGAATAAAARAVGFRSVLSSDGDVEVLAHGIAARRRELKGAVLHPGAVEPSGDLAGALAAEGVEARALPIYETGPSELDDEALAALAAQDVVLLHSAKAARLFADLAERTPVSHLRAFCLSRAVMEPLVQTPLVSVAFAPFPLESALLNLLDR